MQQKNNTQNRYNRSRYRPGVAQWLGRDIALLFHDRGTRRGWAVSSTPRPHFTPGKDPVPILQEAGWAPEPICTGGKSHHHWDSIPDRPARSQSLYRVSYTAHQLTGENKFQIIIITIMITIWIIIIIIWSVCACVRVCVCVDRSKSNS